MVNELFQCVTQIIYPNKYIFCLNILLHMSEISKCKLQIGVNIASENSICVPSFPLNVQIF